MSTLTKVFIVLQLIFSLALSVMVVMVVSAQPKYKDQVEAWQKIAFAAQASAASKGLESQSYLARLTQSEADLKNLASSASTEYLKISAQLAESQKTIAGHVATITAKDVAIKTQTDNNKSLQDQYTAMNLEYNKALEAARVETNKAAELTRAIDKLTQERDQLTRALRRTQEELAQVNGEFEDFKNKPKPTVGSTGSGGGTVASGAGVPAPIIVDAQPAINGAINRVDAKAGRTYFTLPLGTRDGIQNGMSIVIARGPLYVGDAEIVSSTVDQSVAVVKILNRNQTVQAGDIATISR